MMLSHRILSKLCCSLIFLLFVLPSYSDDDVASEKVKLLNLMAESTDVEIRKRLLEIYESLDEDIVTQKDKLLSLIVESEDTDIRKKLLGIYESLGEIDVAPPAPKPKPTPPRPASDIPRPILEPTAESSSINSSIPSIEATAANASNDVVSVDVSNSDAEGSDDRDKIIFGPELFDQCKRTDADWISACRVPLREKQDSVELIRPLAELGKHFLVQATKNEDDRKELIRRSVLFYERAIRIIESNYSASDVETFIRLMWQIAPDMLELGSFNSFEVLPSLTKFGKLAADLGAENEQYRYGLYVRSLEFYDQAIKTLESWRRSYEDPKLSELWQAVLPILNEVLQLEDEAGLSQSDSIAFQISTRESTLAAAEVFYGPDSDKLLGLLTRLGSHFANPDALTPYLAVALLHRRYLTRSDYLLSYALDYRALSEIRLEFKNSRFFYARAIQIIEKNHGDNDTRIVSPLEEIAKVNLLEGYPVERVLPLIERALYIVESNPNTGIEQRIRINLKLADFYSMTQNTKEATTAYQKTWHLMQGADEGMGKVLETPVPLNFFIDPRPYVQYVKKKSSGPNEDLFIEAQYSVGKDGRARKVKIIDDNMGVTARRYLRQDLKIAKFRPGVVDGEVIETPNLIFRHRFRVVEEPADSNQTNALFESLRFRERLGSSDLPLALKRESLISTPNPATLDALRYNQ